MSERTTITELVGESAQASRANVPYAAATWVGLATHVVLLAVFALLGVWPMAIFNVGSVLVFVVVRILFQQKRLLPALVIAITEVVAHQVLAVYFCGWEPGFQYYLLSVAPLCLMLPAVSRPVRVVATAIPAVVFLVLVFSHPVVPAHPLPSPLGHYLGVANLLTSFAVLWVFTYFYRNGAEKAEGALAEAMLRTERILHGILPPAVVERLRHEPGKVVADRFDEATVLFADLVGFTPLAQKRSPEDLVVLLDDVFGSFDVLVDERGLEKIKTIGDAYMVASGVPEPRPDHAEAMADLALAMRASLEAKAAALGEDLAIRIGLHTGPVVAGVIGRTKFAYDLWGDAVNVAARMESHGEPGRIHVSAKTGERLRERFALEARGTVEIKGKGPMETCWLLGPLDVSASAPAGPPSAQTAAAQR